MKIRGILFDMDGVILETERLGRTIYIEECHKRGYPQMDEAMYQNLLGLTREADCAFLKNAYGEDFPFDEVYDTYRDRLHALAPAGKLPCRPCVAECFKGLKERGLLIALATSTSRPIVESYIQHIPEMQNVFDASVCGGEVPRSKPAPDIYLEAAKRLGLRPEECLGVEDSPNGLKAITASGARSVFVPDLLPYQDFMAGTVNYEIEHLGRLCELIDRLQQED